VDRVTVKELINRLEKIENKDKMVLHKFNINDEGWANIAVYDECYDVYICADCSRPFDD
jgi:hypothetical protein